MKNNRSNIGPLLQASGMDVSKYDESFLEKVAGIRISATGCPSEEAYAVLLDASPEERQTLTESIRISYSEFFRNPLTFAVLERIIMPSLALRNKKAGQKEIRIWSAACAAGQEPYSIAMLLEEMNSFNEGSDYRIFATDADTIQVIRAKTGIYQADALLNLTMRRVNNWFTKEGKVYEVKPQLKKQVDFSIFDLFSEQFSAPPASIFGDFHLVFCSNLLFYYKPGYRDLILRKMENSLANGGYLVTGEAERDLVPQNQYDEVVPGSAVFRLKTKR